MVHLIFSQKNKMTTTRNIDEAYHGGGGMSVLEIDTGTPAYDDMEIHTAKHIRGALICEPNLFMIVGQPPPYQNPTGNIREMKIPQAQAQSNISESSKHRNDKQIALFSCMHAIGNPYFKGPYSEGTACDNMGFR
jgi:hypothetical protein